MKRFVQCSVCYGICNHRMPITRNDDHDPLCYDTLTKLTLRCDCTLPEEPDSLNANTRMSSSCPTGVAANLKPIGSRSSSGG